MATAELGETAARRRADDIQSRLNSLAADLETLGVLIADAYRDKDWQALGYESWADYVHGEYSTHLIKLDKATRRQWTKELRGAGMSTYEIAPVTNVSQMQASRDARETNVSVKPPTPKLIKKLKLAGLSTVELKARVEEAIIPIHLGYDPKTHHLHCPHCAAEIGAGQ